MLTDRELKSAKATEEKPEIWLSDELNGLSLRVSLNRVKTWVVRYGTREKRRKLVIGQYPDMPLTAARARAAEVMQQYREGGDPKHELEEKKQLRDEAITVADLVTALVKVLDAKRIAPRGRPDVENRLMPNLVEKHGNKPARSMSKTALAGIVLDLQKDGKFEMARRVGSDIKRLWRWGFDAGLIDQNPVENWTPPVLKKNKTDKTPLAFTELAAFLKLLERIPGDGTRTAGDGGKVPGLSWQVRDCLHVLAHTGQRPGEVMMMRWRDLDLDAKSWTIPAEHIKTRSKSNKSHSLPLSMYISDFLCALKQRTYSTGREYVFSNDSDKLLEEKALGHAIRRIRENCSEVPAHMTPNTLRHTFSTRCADLKLDVIAVEKQQNHVLTGMLAVYNKSNFWEQRQDLCESWSAKLVDLQSNQNVV